MVFSRLKDEAQAQIWILDKSTQRYCQRFDIDDRDEQYIEYILDNNCDSSDRRGDQRNATREALENDHRKIFNEDRQHQNVTAAQKLRGRVGIEK